MLHFPSILSYGFLSFSMAFFNKALFEISDFRYSLFVVFIQLVFVVLLFQILDQIHFTSVPVISHSDVRIFLIPSIFYSLSTITSLQALMKLNVAIYVVIKRCTPAFTFFLQSIVLKQKKLDFKTGACVLAITSGAVITSISDLTFHLESYVIGSLSVIFQSLYLLTVQRCSEHKTSAEVLYIISLISLPMVLVCMLLFSDEISNIQAYDGYNTFSFWLYFLLSTFGGGLLNGTTFWCIMQNSALTTSVIGVLKSVLQVLFGLFVFDRLSININTVIGIMLSIAAGTMFSYLEYKSKYKKSPTSTNHIDYEQESQHSTNVPFDMQAMPINSEKSNDDTMNTYILLFYISYHFSSIHCNKPCSREGSRIVRDYFTRALGPIYEKNQIAIPLECVFSPIRDLFYRQELNKVKLSNDKWLCKYCNKTFYSEYYLDIHFGNRHNNTLLQTEQTVCLSDYCSIFRCDVLKRRKRSLKSLNPLARRSQLETKRKPKRIINQQQLKLLRTDCTSLINRCIPENIRYDLRMKLQHQMQAEVCAYLTTNRYFELPAYRKPLVNFTVIFCLVIFFGMCLVGVGVVTHSDWKLDDHDECQSSKHLSDETISAATALLSTTPPNSIIHSSKNSSATVRQRVQFKPCENECQHSRSHSNVHHHHHHHHHSAHN